MENKTPQNVDGRFYVHVNCINCSLCTEIAGDIFATDHDEGYEYVKKQPQNEAEIELVEELIQLCPASAVRENKN